MGQLIFADGFDTYVSSGEAVSTAAAWAFTRYGGFGASANLVPGRNNGQCMRLDSADYNVNSAGNCAIYLREPITVNQGESIIMGAYIQSNLGANGTYTSQSMCLNTGANYAGTSGLFNYVTLFNTFYFNGQNTGIVRSNNAWQYIEIGFYLNGANSKHFIRVNGSPANIYEITFDSGTSSQTVYPQFAHPAYLNQAGTYYFYVEDITITKSNIAQDWHGPLEIREMIDIIDVAKSGFNYFNASNTVDAINTLDTSTGVTSFNKDAYLTYKAEMREDTVGYLCSVAGTDQNISAYSIKFDEGASALTLGQVASLKPEPVRYSTLLQTVDCQVLDPITEITTTDPNYNNVVLLITGNGTDGQKTQTDKSRASKKITLVEYASVSVLNKKFGTGSIEMDNATDHMYCAIDEDFKMYTGDFTAEMWIYPSSVTGTVDSIIRCGSDAAGATASAGGWTWVINADDTMSYVDDTGIIFSSTTPLTQNTWQHIALCRKSGEIRFFVNGVQDGVATNYEADLNGTLGQFYMGGNPSDLGFVGNVEDVRISKGLGRYDTNFLPPSAGFDYTYWERYFRLRVAK